MADRPRQSPQPPAPPLEEPKTDPGAPVTRGDLKKALGLNEVWTVLVAVATAAAALLGGYALFISKAEAAGEKAAQEVSARQDKLEESQKEVKLDMRDLYKAVMYGKRSERLERPVESTPKDGGRP